LLVLPVREVSLRWVGFIVEDWLLIIAPSIHEDVFPDTRC
jgi:hypothetical protein